MPKATTTTPTRGLIQVEIGGQLRTFKFGMNTLSNFSQLHSGKPGDFGDQFTKDPIGALRDLAYCGLLTRRSENDLPEDFTPETVGDWIDEMPQADWDQVRTVMMGALALGNTTPAATAKP